jgi:toxin ParE1/3/4
MSRKLIVTPRADSDIDDICDHLRERDPRVSLRMFNECKTAIAMIEKFPEAGGRLLLDDQEDLDFRYVRPKSFDWYLIFYRLTESKIEVVRVLHGSRDLAAALIDD